MNHALRLAKILTLSFILWTSGNLSAQTGKPIKEWYSMSVTELIFSSSNVTTAPTDSISLDPVVRFTLFFHLQFQFHYNFGAHAGLYTGIGSRNVGFINKFQYLNADVTLKQRSYSLGIPLAFKFGNMTTNKFIALGGEAEMMFAYKEKVFYGGSKQKRDEWFSDKVNLFNPSLFAELHFSKNGYLKFKYYMNDFLQNREMGFYIPETGHFQHYNPTSSKMFYFSIGTTIKNPGAKKHATKSEV